MSLFTSHRERRLWLWALAVVVAIYSTLGLAGKLARALQKSQMLEISFAVGLLLVVVAILTSGLTRRPALGEIGMMLGILTVYGMVVVRMGISPAERTHLFEYGLLAVLIHQALEERSRPRRRAMLSITLAVVITALLGWLDEGIQAVLPNRYYDVRDVGFNALAGAMAIAANRALAWARARSIRSQIR
ncbi:MAG: VanZ family protein [Thermoanaerobaculia bacterium]|nr:VanZ family protein [Thermoanaerobaculia bacterium]